jgi:hypothetical protein
MDTTWDGVATAIPLSSHMDHENRMNSNEMMKLIPRNAAVFRPSYAWVMFCAPKSAPTLEPSRYLHTPYSVQWLSIELYTVRA